MKYFVARQESKRTQFCLSMATLNTFVLLTAQPRQQNKRERTAAFP